MSHSLIISVVSPIRCTKCWSSSFVALISDGPYHFFVLQSIIKVPLFLFKKQIHKVDQFLHYFTNKIGTNQRYAKLTITSVAILFFTSKSMSFHFLTPISGALFLVYTTTSSTKDHWLPPTGPPSLEIWTSSFIVPCLALLLDTFKPLMGPRPLNFLFSLPHRPSKWHTID
jgi:hypothetical protein